MSKVFVDITMTLDGFIATSNVSVEHPLGEGGERIHEWVYGLESWREYHGLEGGEVSRDSEVLEEAIRNLGAVIMGRRMFNAADGPWGENPSRGPWGDEPPFHVPVFVLTHHPREPLEMEGGTTFFFVTEGIDRALELAREAAGERDVSIAGGAEIIQQYLRAGLIDEMQIHIAPVLFGQGRRLFDDLGREHIELEPVRVLGSPAVAHLKYRIASNSARA